MEEKRYIFDKRVVKKNLIKYGIMFLILIPVLLVVDYFLQTWNMWAVVGIDVAIGLVVIIIESWIYSAILKKRQAKQDNVVEEKEELPKKENRGINRYPKKTVIKKEKK